MKCAYHSEKDAVAQCSKCGKFFCEGCGENTGEEPAVCNRCTTLSNVWDAVEVEDGQTAEQPRISTAAGKKKPRGILVVIILLALAALLVNLYLYLGQDVPNLEEFDPYKHPLLTADLINDGIEEYAEDHGGQFPAKLTDLFGKYLPYEKITPSVLDMFSYRRFSPTSYELRFKDADNVEFADIVFGKEDK